MKPSEIIFFAVYMPVILIYLVLVAAMSHRLKSHHFETWDRLGRFSLILNNSISNGLAFARFAIFSNEYKQLNDPKFNAMALATKILFAVAVVLFGLSLFPIFHQ